MKIRALIVEDEAFARKRLKRFLVEDEEIEIIGECDDGRSAVEAIERLKPDLIFLDIQVPELDGFGILRSLKFEEELPVVVFVTAFDKYAIKAFEFQALDYLLKPFEKERLQATTARAKNQIRQKDKSDLTKKLRELITSAKPEPKYQERLAIKTGGEIVFLKMSEIDWIEAAGNYLRLHAAAGRESHLIRETMGAMEKRLDPEIFLRIQRSVIVNATKIKKLSPLFRGEYIVIMQDGKRLTSSRNYGDKLTRFIKATL